jgi:hypothetical protein
MSYHHAQEPSKANARKEKEAAQADEDDSTSSVVNLTDANFESVVRESTADILLDFYGTCVGGLEEGVRLSLCVCMCVFMCVRLCVRAYVCVLLCMFMYGLFFLSFSPSIFFSILPFLLLDCIIPEPSSSMVRPLYESQARVQSNSRVFQIGKYDPTRKPSCTDTLINNLLTN